MNGPGDPWERAWRNRALARAVSERATLRAPTSPGMAQRMGAITSLRRLVKPSAPLMLSDPAPLASHAAWTSLAGPAVERPLVLARAGAAAERASASPAAAERDEQGLSVGQGDLPEPTREEIPGSSEREIGRVQAPSGEARAAGSAKPLGDEAGPLAGGAAPAAEQALTPAKPSTLERLRRALQRPVAQEEAAASPEAAATASGGGARSLAPEARRATEPRARATPTARAARIIEQQAERPLPRGGETPSMPLAQPARGPAQGQRQTAGEPQEARPRPGAAARPTLPTPTVIQRSPETPRPIAGPHGPRPGPTEHFAASRPAMPTGMPLAGGATGTGRETDLSGMRYTELSPEYDAEGQRTTATGPQESIGGPGRGGAPRRGPLETMPESAQHPGPEVARVQTGAAARTGLAPSAPQPPTVRAGRPSMDTVQRMPEAAEPWRPMAAAPLGGAAGEERGETLAEPAIGATKRLEEPGARTVEVQPSPPARIQRLPQAMPAPPAAPSPQQAMPEPAERTPPTARGAQRSGDEASASAPRDHMRDLERAAEQGAGLEPSGAAERGLVEPPADEDVDIEATTILPLQEMPLEEAIFGAQRSPSIAATPHQAIRRMTEEPEPGSTATAAAQPAQMGARQAPAVQVNLVRRQAAPATPARDESARPAPAQGEAASSGAPDVDQLAEEVYRRLRERLRVERERYGAMRRR